MPHCAVEALTASVPLAEYIPACVDIPKFLVCCQKCENYGRRWACPPFDFAPMTIWSRYTTLTLHARLLRPASGMTYPDVMADLSRAKSALFSELLALEKATPGSLALSAGTCDLCENCTRIAGKPCVSPEKLRYSIEALGGDVEQTCRRYLNTSLCWATPPSLPPYLLLVGALLLPDSAKKPPFSENFLEESGNRS